MNDLDEPPSRGSVEDAPTPWFVVVAGLALVAGVAFVALFILPTWMVNFDATGYLALAANIRDGVGFVAPDGSTMTVRGPGYPLLLAMSWLFGGYSSGIAMVLSRLVFVASGLLASLIVFTMTRSRLAVLGVVLVFFFQPILLPAGVMFLLPDGLASMFVLVAIALVGAAHMLQRYPLYVLAGLAVGFAFVTKESHTLITLGMILWVLTRDMPMSRRLRALGWFGIGFSIVWMPWVMTGIAATATLPGALPHGGLLGSWMAALAVPMGSILILPLAGIVPDVRIRMRAWIVGLFTFAFVVAVTTRFVGDLDRWLALPDSIRHILSSQAYLGATIVGVVALGGLAVLGVRAIENRDVADLMVISTIAAFGFLPYIVIANTTIRNVVLLPILVAILAGFAVASRGGAAWTRAATWSLIVVSAIAGMLGIVRLSNELDVTGRTAESGVTVTAASWLTDNGDGAPTAGTPIAYQSIWRLGDRLQSVRLVPIYVSPRAVWDEGGRAFENAFSWLGKPKTTRRTGTAAAYSFDRSVVTAVFAEDLVSLYDSVKYVVLTGNTRYPISSPDGGIVLLALAQSESITPVFVGNDRNAQWVAIVEFVSRPNFDGQSPIVRVSNGSVPLVEGASSVLDQVGYVAAVRQVLVAMQARIGETK